MSTIAVIRYGHIGGTLARKWSEAGHGVTFGARDPQGQTLRALAEAIHVVGTGNQLKCTR